MRGQIVLPVELAEELGVDRVGRLAERAHRRDPITGEPADGGEPLAERTQIVPIGVRELSQLRGEGVRPVELLAAAKVGGGGAGPVATTQRRRTPLAVGLLVARDRRRPSLGHRAHAVRLVGGCPRAKRDAEDGHA